MLIRPLPDFNKHAHMQVSMPGMMDTVLNLGLNDQVAEGLGAKAGVRFAYDA